MKKSMRKLEWINRKYTGLKLIQEFILEEKKQNCEMSDTIKKEIEELRILFDILHKTEDSDIDRNARQNYWRIISRQNNNPRWKQIAELAELCYGHFEE